MSERRRVTPAFIIVVLLALVAAAIQSQRTAPDLSADAYWTEGFHLAGVNGPVHALTFGPDGSLYAGGEFTIAGSATANGIARWDGANSSWHPLGSGVAAEYRPSVNALAIGPDGSLYVGGKFTTAGGVAAENVARWDGATSSWQPLGGIMNGEVYALAVGQDGSLYAGGWFTRAGGWVATNRIARWDGARWRPLGSGIGGGEDPMVNSLAVGPDGSLYAGGRFTSAGGAEANHIARWDGATSSWHPLDSGIEGQYAIARVNALTFGPDGSLYAGGYFARAGGVEVNNIARWDGARWHPLGSGMAKDYQNVKALAFGPNGSLYAGGSFTTAGEVDAKYIARWDGATSSWHALGANSGMVDPVSALALGPDGSLYAGGRFTTAGEVDAKYIARWDGATSSWHPVGTGSGMDGKDPDVSSLTVGPDGSLYAGGRFTTAGGVEANNIARWDGTTSSWHPLDSGMEWEYAMVNALTFGSDGSLYAGGSFATAGGVAANYIARWDGARWHTLGSGMIGSVDALAVGPDGSLYAGGHFITAGGVAASRIARWDGALWHPLANGIEGEEQPHSYVSALALGPDGSLYAGGRFTTAGGVTANNIARWDGAQWHSLGGGMNSWVFALAFGPDGSLYAGGRFTEAGGVAANRIARWDSATSSWHALGSGVKGPDNYTSVYALAFGPDGALHAGGHFTKAGGLAAYGIARWDGATWHPLGSGTSSSVSTLAFGPDGSLYVGGEFTEAGGKPSAYIAQWTGFTHLPAPAISPDQSRLPSDAFGQEAWPWAAGDSTSAAGRLP